MTIYLHIGTQKTGTTTIQRGLSAAKHKLAAEGVIYPNPMARIEDTSPEIDAHHWLCHAIHNERLRYTPSASFDRIDNHVAALRQEAETADVAIISSEDFCRLRNPKMISRTVSYFPGCVVIIYLRRQDYWLDSLFGQMVKGGYAGLTPEKLASIEAWRLDYSNFISLWEDAVGNKSRIIVRPYDEGIDAWGDFMNTVGRPDLAERFRPAENANKSLPFELTMFMRQLERYGPQTGMRRLLETLDPFFPTVDGLKYIDQAFGEKLLQAGEMGNRIVAQRYLGRNELFSNNEPARVTERSRMDGDDFVSVVGGVLIRLLDRLGKAERKIEKLQKRRMRFWW